MAEITKFKLIADINGTTYINGQSIDYSFIRNRQEYLYGVAYRKLMTGLTTQICCMGDSLTYGQDTYSADKRPPDATPCPDGSLHSATRAGQTYPEALQVYLQQVYGYNVTVINRGYSGDYVEAGYNRWFTPHSSDITIIMYGTNDSRVPYVPTDIRGNLDKYIVWYEQLIIREILWGKAVVILTPPKLPNADDVHIKTFAIALSALGEKYSIPVIDSTLFTANYPSTIYSDVVHLATSGYQVFAAKAAALFIGEGAKKPMEISDGETLLTRPNIDNVQYFGGAIFASSGGLVQTPSESSPNAGVVAEWAGLNKGLIYSFYTQENDMMILPLYYSTTGNLRVTLDFNTVGPQNSDDMLVDYPVAFNESLVKQTTYSAPLVPTLADLIKATGDNTQPILLRIAEKGWHTLKIDTTDSTANIVFNAVHFMNYRSYKQQKDILIPNELIIQTHILYSDTNNVLYTDINYDTLLASLNFKLNDYFWKNKPAKLTIYNWNNSVLEYRLGLGGKDGSGFEFCTTPTRFNFATTPTERTCTSIAYTTETNTLRFNWVERQQEQQ